MLTAAHCFLDASLVAAHYAIIAGRHNLSESAAGSCSQQITPSALTLHPSFERNTYVNDIALVELSEPVRCAA